MKQITNIECETILGQFKTNSFIENKLLDLKGHNERPDYHPEDNAYQHVGRVLARALELGDRAIIATAVLHDICKWDSRVLKPDGYFSAPGHDKKAANLIENTPDVKDWISKFGADVTLVQWMCGEHMRAKLIGEMRPVKVKALVQHPGWNKLAAFGWLDDMLLTDLEALTGAKVALKTGDLNL